MNDCLRKKCSLTFKEAPSTKDEEGPEEVGGEVVQGGDHHTWGLVAGFVACAVGSCEVVAGTLLPTVQPRGAVFQMWHFWGL